MALFNTNRSSLSDTGKVSAQFAPDLVVDAQGNLKSAAATWCAGAPRRTGMSASEWREPLGARVINDPAPATPGR